ncbi:MAG: LURP-one-related family protein [Steroidobacter sp.]
MRYVMKQNLLAWGADFTIQDADGRDAFVVDGKGFSLGDQLSFQDLDGNELAYIKQRLLSWGPTYEIHQAGQLRAVVKKELFTLFGCSFAVDVPGPDDLDAEGDFIDQEYEFSRGNRVVASVSKRWFSWSDTYGVDIADGEDHVLILASAVVIDMVCHQDEEH